MKKTLLFAAMASLSFSNAHADIIGAGEAVMIAKAAEQIAILKNQLSKLQSTYSTTVNQYNTSRSILEKAKAQANSVDELVKRNGGHFGFGSLKNSVSDLKRQQWSADEWQDALKGAGNTSQYQRLLKAYKDRHPSMKEQDFKKGASKEVIQSYQEAKAVNEATAVQSEYAYNEVNASLKRIHDLSQSIEKAETTKAAIDLNSRLLTELAYLQTQNIKAQSLMNQQLTQKQSAELAGRGQTSQLLTFNDDYE